MNKYPREDLPEELTTYVRSREGYDYYHHAEVGSDNAAFVTDEIVDRFCISGRPGIPRPAPRARAGRRRPVQPVPDERQRRTARGCTGGHHPGHARRSGRLTNSPAFEEEHAHADPQRHHRHRRRLLLVADVLVGRGVGRAHRHGPARRRDHRRRNDRRDRQVRIPARSTCTRTWSCRSAARSPRTRSRPEPGRRPSAGRPRSSTSPSSRAERPARGTRSGTPRPRETPSPTTGST